MNMVFSVVVNKTFIAVVHALSILYPNLLVCCL